MHACVSALPCVGVYVWEHVHVSAPVYVRVEAREQLVSRVLATSLFLRQSLHWTLSWSSLIQLGWPVSKATFQCWITDVRGHIWLVCWVLGIWSQVLRTVHKSFIHWDNFLDAWIFLLFFFFLTALFMVLEATKGWVSNFFWDSIHALGLKRSPCDNYF